ncbi:hypothetical protein [Marinobacter shengliensis]|uniref:hypothetical protein n=1 Tax=Marinobacter shengliensis TaxID=1389223 RepID=UPI0011089305|nr:hypothetical protein [Marinobacter shengliensis]
MGNKTESNIIRAGRKFGTKPVAVGAQYQGVPSGDFLSCELSNEQIASRIADLMGEDSTENSILLQYAEGLEKAAEMDDLSLVRTGREAERFESEFRKFVSEFPGVEAVTLKDGEAADTGIALARMEPALRRNILTNWASIIREKAKDRSN